MQYRFDSFGNIVNGRLFFRVHRRVRDILAILLEGSFVSFCRDENRFYHVVSGPIGDPKYRREANYFNYY